LLHCIESGFIVILLLILLMQCGKIYTGVDFIMKYNYNS